MSVETMRHAELGEYNAKRIANIDLAAKTLSRIYEDLVFLTFGMKKEGGPATPPAQVLPSLSELPWHQPAPTSRSVTRTVQAG